MSSAVNPGAGTADDRRRASAGGPSGHQDLVARQKEQFGGMKFGCSFFGWLTAVGTAALLTALLAGVATALGTSGVFNPQQASTQVRTIGVVAGVVLLVVVLIAYIAGGYVAARMARFSGLKQGLGVWLWAVIAAIVVTVLGFVAGNRSDLLSRVSGLPRIPMEGGAVTGSIITVVAIFLVSLVGALLGGLAGMRYHRRVDRAGFEEA